MRNALWRDRRGATAITFGVLAIPVLLGVGLSVDYANMSKDRALVQGIADRALLASAMMPSATDAQVTTAVNAYIAAEKDMKAIGGIDSVTVTFPAADRVLLRIDAHSPTTLMNMITDRLSFVVTTEALRGLSGDIEVAIALDTTLSMNTDGKLDAAKIAAKELIDTLAGTEGAKVSYSLVPFAQHVNVGTDLHTWLDVQAENTTSCVKSPPPNLHQHFRSGQERRFHGIRYDNHMCGCTGYRFNLYFYQRNLERLRRFTELSA